MPPAIVVEQVSKRYVIGHAEAGGVALTLREELSRLASALVRRWQPRGGGDDFWALRDVSVTIEPGEVVGILGRNGAGKSTLLKILSRITKPTAGRVRLRGRLGSLLEVGTGFNPELSGRENVFLNGAVLGMSRKEVRRKFDDIVAFSEIDDFLDTPVKRYSSGMYMRLAFSVAAFLEPEILIVDEVLGVGDIAFQQKCMGKIESLVKKEHRTVLLVSHNPTALKALCTKAMFLHRGRLLHYGDVEGAVRLYTNSEGIVLDERGRLTYPELDWTGGGVTAPATAAAQEPFRATRAYRVGRAAIAGDFRVLYYACRGTTFGGPDDLFLGGEVISREDDKSLGAHAGPGPELRVGRPGSYHIAAVLDPGHSIARTSESGRVAVSPQPTVFAGALDVVLDNGRPGYSESGGGWQTEAPPGSYGGDLRLCPAGSGVDRATWQLTGLEPGWYEVQVSWPPHPDRASNALYRLYDGDALLTGARVNQRQGPTGPGLDGAYFHSLGKWAVAGSHLRVVLGNDADGPVMADAVRVLRADADGVAPAGTHWTGSAGDDDMRLRQAWVRSLDPDGTFHTACDLEVGVEMELARRIDNFILGFWLFSGHGHELAFVQYDDGEPPPAPPAGPGTLTKLFRIPADTLSAGTYRVRWALGVYVVKALLQDGEGSLTFTLENVRGRGRRFPVSNVRGLGALFRPAWGARDG